MVWGCKCLIYLMKKLQSYFIREILHTTLILMLVVLAIMISVYFIKLLSSGAAGQISIRSLFALLGIALPGFINLLLPVTFFLALVLTMNRLLYDNELITAFSCGVGWFTLVRWLLLPTCLLALLSAFLSFWLVPKMNYYQSNLLQISSQNQVIRNFLQTGRFFAIGSDNQVLYVGEFDSKSGESHDIFIYRKVNNETNVILAPEGKITDAPQWSKLTLGVGNSYQGVLGTLAYQMVGFTSFNLLLIPSYNTNYSDQSTISAINLVKTKTLASLLELEARSSYPLAMFVLMVMGVILGDMRPRKGKYLYFSIGVGIFMVYFNLLSIVRSMILNHALKLLPGLYTVHLILFLIALFFLFRREGFFSFLSRHRSRAMRASL